MAEITREQVVLALASGATPPRLSGIDLSGLNLSGLNFRHADLRGSRLTHANLSQADLRQADLSGANLTRANLTGADLSQVAQKGLLGRYERTQLLRAVLNEADLRSANLEGAVFDGASLVKADLRGAHVGSASFKGADLTAADLRQVVSGFGPPFFSQATLRDANLSGATLSGFFLGADLTGANLSGANLRGSFFNDFAFLSPKKDLVPGSSACLRNANLVGADLTGVDLREVDLTGADLAGTKLLYCASCGIPGTFITVRKGTFWTGRMVEECPACGAPWASATEPTRFTRPHADPERGTPAAPASRVIEQWWRSLSSGEKKAILYVACATGAVVLFILIAEFNPNAPSLPRQPSGEQGRCGYRFCPGDSLVNVNNAADIGVVTAIEESHTFQNGTVGRAYIIRRPNGIEMDMVASVLEEIARRTSSSTPAPPVKMEMPPSTVPPGSTLPRTPSQPDQRDWSYEAWYRCRADAARGLKAPSTASFSSYDESHVTKQQAAQEYSVGGWVDAQNSFGAMLRSQWVCTAQRVSHDEWHVQAAVLPP